MPDNYFKLLGGLDPASQSVGDMTEGIGYPLRPVEPNQSNPLNTGVFDTVFDMSIAVGFTEGAYAQCLDYADGFDSGVLYFIAVATGGTPDGGSLIAGSGVDWEQIFGDYVDGKSFGVGGADSGARLQTAIEYVWDNWGGGIVRLSGDHVMEQNIVVRQGVSLIGDLQYPTGWKVDTKLGSILRFEEGFGITLDSSVSGFLITKLSTPFPQTSLESESWTGTAIQGTNAGVSIENCYIAGFDWAVVMTGVARFNMNMVFIDCQSGVKIDGSVDMDRLTNVHCWPFLSSGGEGSRKGDSFYLLQPGSWARLQGYFSIGHVVGLRLDSTTHISLDNCAFDCDTTEIVTHVIIEGNAANTHMSNCDFGGRYSYGLVIDIADNDLRQHVQISGCLFSGGNAIRQISILDARVVTITGAVVFSSTEAAVWIGSDMGLYLEMSGCQIHGVQNAIENFEEEYTTNTIRFDPNNIVTLLPGGQLWKNAIDASSTVASASNIEIPTESDLILVTGTTTIDSFDVGLPNRRVTLDVLTGFDITTAGNIDLLTGATTSYTVGDRPDFICMGSTWYEV
jgi:hypothetical protein